MIYHWSAAQPPLPIPTPRLARCGKELRAQHPRPPAPGTQGKTREPEADVLFDCSGMLHRQPELPTKSLPPETSSLREEGIYRRAKTRRTPHGALAHPTDFDALAGDRTVALDRK